MKTNCNDEFQIEIFGSEKPILLNKKGKPRKRKPKKSRVYFTQDTEDAIIEYLAETNPHKRNEIYNERIQYSFYKLAENIIHTFKFYYTDTSTIEELKHEVITFLLEKLHLFNHSAYINKKLIKYVILEFNEDYEKDSFNKFTNNSPTVTQEQIDNFIKKLNISNECFEKVSSLHPPKAYSYFGTITKRYLIIYNKENYKKLQEKISISELEFDESEEDTQIISDIADESYENNNKIDDLSQFLDCYIKYVDKNLNKIFPKKQEAQIADAINELFKKSDSLEIFNKKAIYIYIREMTNVSTPQITKVIKKLDSIRIKLYNNYYDNGHI